MKVGGFLRTFGKEGIDIPQRRQSVWDLLWRLPKEEVPFAVQSLDG